MRIYIATAWASPAIFSLSGPLQRVPEAHTPENYTVMLIMSMYLFGDRQFLPQRARTVAAPADEPA